MNVRSSFCSLGGGVRPDLGVSERGVPYCSECMTSCGLGEGMRLDPGVSGEVPASPLPSVHLCPYLHCIYPSSCRYTLSAAAVAKGFTAYLASLLQVDLGRMRLQYGILTLGVCPQAAIGQPCVSASGALTMEPSGPDPVCIR